MIFKGNNNYPINCIWHIFYELKKLFFQNEPIMIFISHFKEYDSKNKKKEYDAKQCGSEAYPAQIWIFCCVLCFVFVLPRKHCLSKITNYFLNCPINIWLLIWLWYLVFYQEPTSLVLFSWTFQLSGSPWNFTIYIFSKPPWQEASLVLTNLNGIKYIVT